MKVNAIILGGGIGSRTKEYIPKQFIKINGKSILEHTIEKFEKNVNVDNIILVINSSYKDYIKEEVLNKYKKINAIVEGGKSRRESVYNGLKLIKNDEDKVLIHDGVRPFVSHKTINTCIEALDVYESVYPGIESADTVIEIDKNNIIKRIPIRKNIMRGQTPQGFKVKTIKKAHEIAKLDATVDEEITNECGLIDRYNICETKCIQGNRENIKITYPEDIELIKKLFEGEYEYV